MERSRHRSFKPAHALLCLLFSLPLSSLAFDPLALTPEPLVPSEASTATNGLRVEAWQQHFDWRQQPPGAVTSQQRLMLDFRREWSLGGSDPVASPLARLNLSNRLEWVRSASNTETRHTLRELFLGTEPTRNLFVDLGRINWRSGVAYGFNPTDFLGTGTGIEQASLDPRAQRENRLGTVMLRGQFMHQTGTASLALIPSLASRSSTHRRSPAWHRSNPKRAALLKLSPGLGQTTSLDLLSYWQQGSRPQAGVNITWLASNSLIVHAEAAHARDHINGKHSDITAGFSWASPAGPQITMEWIRDRSTQSPSLFTRIAWNRAFDHPNLSIAAFVRLDIDTKEKSSQLEINWHPGAHQSISLITGHLSTGKSRAASSPLRQYTTLSWAWHF